MCDCDEEDNDTHHGRDSVTSTVNSTACIKFLPFNQPFG